jgi:signal transduction histidine kinase
MKFKVLLIIHILVSQTFVVSIKAQSSSNENMPHTQISADSLFTLFQYSEADNDIKIVDVFLKCWSNIQSYSQLNIKLNEQLNATFNESLNLLLENNQPLSVIILQQFLAQNLYSNGEKETGINYEIETLNLIESLKNPKLKGLGYLILSYTTLQFNRSIEYTLSGLHLLENIASDELLCEIYYALNGNYAIVLEDFQKRLEYAEKYWSVKKKLGSANPSAISLQDTIVFLFEKAICLSNLKSFEEARIFLDSLRDENKNAFWLAKYYDAEGQYFELKGELKEAFVNYLESYKLFNDNNWYQQTCYLAIYLAESYYKIQDYDNGLKFGLRGFELSLNQYAPLQIRASLILSKLYESKGEIRKAYDYLKISREIQEVFNQEDLKNRLASLEIQSVINKNKEDKAILEQQKLQQEQANQNQRRWLITIAAGLFLSLVVVYLLFRNNKNRQKANILLQKQKEEINLQKIKAENALSDLKSAEAQLIASEKLASLGALTAGIAHEIQNPLNFVNNFSEVNSELIDEMNEEIENGNLEEIKVIAKDIKENEQKIIHHGKRAETIVKGMLLHSRGSSGHKEPVDINALCDEYLRLSYHGFRAKDKSFNVEYKTDFDPNLPKINVVPQDIGRVLLNLINNAFYAAPLPPEGGFKDPNYIHKPLVVVKTSYLPPSGGMRGAVCVSVSDNGPGIPSSIVDKIFQPFFTTKPTGQGTGLGLSLAYDMVKAHGGEIKVETKEGKGTTFTIELPITKN